MSGRSLVSPPGGSGTPHGWVLVLTHHLAAVLDFRIGIARHAFPCADLSGIVSIAVYTFDFIEPEYEKLHQALLRKRRSVELFDSLVGTRNEGSREHFE